MQNQNGDVGVKVTHSATGGPVSDEFYNFENLQFGDRTLNIVQAQPSLYFSAIGPGNNSVSPGPDLVRLDSNDNVTPVPIRHDAAASNGSFAGEDGGYVSFAGKLYFYADDPTLPSARDDPGAE